MTYRFVPTAINVRIERHRSAAIETAGPQRRNLVRETGAQIAGETNPRRGARNRWINNSLTHTFS
jgi:hypothetical protein